MILPLWKKNPALYNKYRASSLVIDRPGTRSADQPEEAKPTAGTTPAAVVVQGS